MNIQILELPSLPIECKTGLPKIPAIYFFLSGSQVLYVGKTNNLRHRFLLHHKTKSAKREYSDIKIAWLECNPEALSQTEKRFINQLNPPLNIQKHNTTRGDSRALINITLSISPQEKIALEEIAIQFNQIHGEKPNISKLMRAIADGDLKVIWGDEEAPMTAKQRNMMKGAIALIQEGLAKLIKII